MLTAIALVLATPWFVYFGWLSDRIGRNPFDATSCDIAKSFLARAGVSYDTVAAARGTVARIQSGNASVLAPDPHTVSGGGTWR